MDRLDFVVFYMEKPNYFSISLIRKKDFQANAPLCFSSEGNWREGEEFLSLFFFFQCVIEEPGSKSVLKIKWDGEWSNSKE